MSVGDKFRLKVTFKSDTSERVAQVTPVFSQEGEPIFDTPEEDLVGAFQEECEALLLACVTASLRLVEYAVVPLPGTAASFVLSLGGAGPVGTQGGDPMPPRTATILSFRSPTAGRRGRGRMYLPPASEASNTAGHPTSGHLAAGDALGAAMIGDMPSLSITHLPWVWYIQSLADADFKPVSAYVTRDYWGTQRDRTNIL